MVNRMAVACALAGVLALAGAYAAEDPETVNLFDNGDMEADADGDGIPDEWAWSPHEKTMRLETGPGRLGGRALAIHGPLIATKRYGCAARTTSAFALEKGKAYRFSFWLKYDGEGPPRSVGTSFAAGAGGMMPKITVSQEWKQTGYTFVATKDVPKGDKTSYGGPGGRFQIGVEFLGPVFLDDVVLEEIPREEVPQREGGKNWRAFWPGEVWPPKVGGNLIPNGSFELGSGGWGSWMPHQDGASSAQDRPFRLLSEVDPGVARHGRRSLRIELDGDDLPPNLYAAGGGGGAPYTSLFAGTHGLIPLEVGKRYVLSAWLKADGKDTVAILSVVRARIGSGVFSAPERRFAISTEWQRCTLSFTADTVDVRSGKRRPGATPQLVPVIGLDWRLTGRKTATLWVDCVQLEEADAESAEEPSPFRTREGADAGIDTERIGNIFEKGESLVVSAHAFNDTQAVATLEGSLEVTDYWDRKVFAQPVAWEIGPGEGRSERIDTKITRAGFYRVKLLRKGGDGPSLLANLRAAVIRPYDPKKHAGFPRFGTQRSIAWPSIRKLFGAAGIGSVRYWDFGGDILEPWEGQGAYDNQDKDIDGLVRDGFEVQPMVPEPQAGWNCIKPYDTRSLYQPRHWSAYWHSQPNFRWEMEQYRFPLSAVEPPGGGWAARFQATSKGHDKEEGLPRLQQRDILRLAKDKTYRISFLASATTRGVGRVMLLTYPERAPAGLDQKYNFIGDHASIPRWTKYEFDFTCTTDTLLGSSLQFWPERGGTMSIDDVSLREVLAGEKLGSELVANGDFEDVFIDGGVKTYIMRKVIGPGHEDYRAPDLDKVRAFWTRTVNHFKDRVKHWEVLNEPTYLTIEEYVRYLKTAYLGIKAADREAVVVGGPDALSCTTLGWLNELWSLGAREYLDVLTLHSYEGNLDPEVFEGSLMDMNAFMDDNGGRAPIRMTEGWRFADDDTLVPPGTIHATYGPMDSEKHYGDYIVRYATIMFGNGVDSIQFFFGISCPGLTRPDHAGVLEYGCVPRKIYPVMTAFSHIVPPEARIEKKLHFFGYAVYAYVFSRADDAVAVVWSPKKTYRIDRNLLKDVRVLDIFAEPVVGDDILIGESAIYLVGDSTEAVLEAAGILERAREVTSSEGESK